MSYEEQVERLKMKIDRELEKLNKIEKIIK